MADQRQLNSCSTQAQALTLRRDRQKTRRAEHLRAGSPPSPCSHRRPKHRRNTEAPRWPQLSSRPAVTAGLLRHRRHTSPSLPAQQQVLGIIWGPLEKSGTRLASLDADSTGHSPSEIPLTAASVLPATPLDQVPRGHRAARYRTRRRGLAGTASTPSPSAFLTAAQGPRARLRRECCRHQQGGLLPESIGFHAELRKFPVENPNHQQFPAPHTTQLWPRRPRAPLTHTKKLRKPLERSQAGTRSSPHSRHTYKLPAQTPFHHAHSRHRGSASPSKRTAAWHHTRNLLPSAARRTWSRAVRTAQL